jgi:hypothetical protein
MRELAIRRGLPSSTRRPTMNPLTRRLIDPLPW